MVQTVAASVTVKTGAGAFLPLEPVNAQPALSERAAASVSVSQTLIVTVSK